MSKFQQWYGITEHQYIYLTPEEQTELDSTRRAYRKVMNLVNTNKLRTNPVRALWRFKSSSEWLAWYDTFMQRTNLQEPYGDLLEYEKEMRSKFGPQGGIPEWSSILDSYERSYTYASRVGCVSHTSHRPALRFLMKRISDRLNIVGYPQILPYTTFGSEFSGFPICLKKNDYRSFGSAIKDYESTGFLPYPNIPGTRYARGRKRAINMDSFNNVYEIAGLLSGCRQWLRTYFPEYFGSWLNPRTHTDPTITSCLRKGYEFGEFDYTHIDETFSLDLVQTYVYPIYRLLIPSDYEYFRFTNFVNNLFYQPIYMGDRMSVGLHSLLSGQAITNDFETIFSIINMIMLVMEDGQNPGNTDIFCLGDDALVGAKKFNTDIRVIFKQLSESVGLEVNLLKQRLSHNPRYLRKTYGISYPKYVDVMGNSIVKGAYPISLALNSLINPEFYEEDQDKNTIASLQICDNLDGHPLFNNVIPAIWSQFKGTVSDAIVDTRVDDWWFKVYGTRWAPSSSPTVTLLKKMKLVPDMIKKLQV